MSADRITVFRRPGGMLAPLLLALASGALAPAPVLAQTEWSARIGYRRALIDAAEAPWSDWERWSAEGRRTFNGGGLGLEVLRSRRFGMDDDAAAVDLYLDVADRAYLHARSQWAPGARVLPRHDHGLVLYRATTTGWEGSIGYRYMGFGDQDAHIVGASLARYLPGWYLRVRGDLNPSFGRNAFYASAAVRRFVPSLDGLVEATAGAGDEVVEVAAGPTVDIRASRFVHLRTELYPWRSVGVAAEVGWTGVSGLPGRTGLGASALIRW